MNNDINNRQAAPFTTPEQGNGSSYPNVPAKPVKSRRVGTITMALSLIAAGTLLVLAIILPQLDILMVLRFAPLVLVFLGIEILISAFRFKSEKIKYDGLSIFICIILILGSTAAGIIPNAVRMYLNSSFVESRLRTELDKRSYDALGAFKDDIHSLRWAVYTENYRYDENMTVEDIRPENQPQAQVYFNGGFASAEDFAAKSHKVLQELKTVCPSIRYASFYSAPSKNSFHGEIFYSLWLDGIFQINWDEKTIAENVEKSFWLEDEDSYVDEQTYEDRQSSPDLPDNESINGEENYVEELNLPDYLEIRRNIPTTTGYTMDFTLDEGTDLLLGLTLETGVLSVSISDAESGREVTAFDWNEETNEDFTFYLENGNYVMDISLVEFSGHLFINQN